MKKFLFLQKFSTDQMGLSDTFAKPLVKQDRLIFLHDLNDQGTLFGGMALKWMDEVAYLTAREYTGQKIVTARIDRIRFITPVKAGSQVEITGNVVQAGNVKLNVWVELWMKEKDCDEKVKAASGRFIFSPTDESGRPVKLTKKNVNLHKKNSDLLIIAEQ